MNIQGELHSTINPTPEELALATKYFQNDCEPFIKRLSEIKAMRKPIMVKNIDTNEVMFIEPEDTTEEVEIKKAIEQLRQKHFPNFTV